MAPVFLWNESAADSRISNICLCYGGNGHGGPIADCGGYIILMIHIEVELLLNKKPVIMLAKTFLI